MSSPNMDRVGAYAAEALVLHRTRVRALRRQVHESQIACEEALHPDLVKAMTEAQTLELVLIKLNDELSGKDSAATAYKL